MLGLEKASLCIDADRVLHKLQEFSKLLHTKRLQYEGLLEILLVVERKIFLLEAWTIWVIQVLVEGVYQEVDLYANARQSPILIRKLEEEWLAVTDVHDVVYGGCVDLILLILLCLWLSCLFLLLLTLCVTVLFLCRLLLFLDQCRSLRRIFVFSCSCLHFLQCSLPFCPLRLEPFPWLQVLHSLRHLAFVHESLEHLYALSLRLPQVLDFVKALVFRRQCEAGIGLGNHALRKVWSSFLAVTYLLLFL
mmetsp:Transcript_94877/g.164680  ORF Transcript_94877/g.164680 Transcript_94877/m.164680 type:complete len:249 (+) Transcript_94877:482-1228(+)